MITLTVNNFKEWRATAKQHILHNVPPEQIIWSSYQAAQGNLLSAIEPVLNLEKPYKTFTVPKTFMDMAESIACQRDSSKWDKLYRALWRITHGEKHLMEVKSDVLVNDLYLFYKAIRRDAHKMKAFVRFKLHVEDGEEYYIAWYKPDHNIARLVSGFFKRRFAVMKWTIMTPGETVSWNGEELIFSEGVPTNINNADDQLETLWCTYYRAIFNPARIKIQAMKNEMPIRFWHGLPEAAMIPSILQEAPARVAKMMREQEGSAVTAFDYFPEKRTLGALENAAASCKGCPIYQCARQTVFGKGPQHANLMIVGEQPGLQEDIEGVPFVGPAGKVLRQELATLGAAPEEIYMTNAVKHFKNVKVNGRQMHRSPGVREISACKPWLSAEIAIVKPKVILCLGVTPAKALINPGFKMTNQHGKWDTFGDEQTVIAATYHPAALLRAPDEQMKETMYKAFRQDLARAFELASA
jgi:probable DNA metabolism protein